MRNSLIAVLGLVAAGMLSGCLMVGGYTTGGGWFMWPGGLGLLVVLALLYFVLRGRR